MQSEIDWVYELQTYIRIDTSHPNVKYGRAIDYLVDLTQRIDAALVYRIFTHSSVPLLVVTKPGLTNRGVLLNTHMDVVDAANVADWLFPPFAGHYSQEDDRIYGRGTQDAKSQAIQYMAVLHHLRTVKLDYTLHVSFVPNQTIGGVAGLSEFVRTPAFRDLNIEFVLDQSCASPFRHFLVFYAERTVWQFVVRIRSSVGNPAMPSNMSCELKLRRLLNEIERFRRRDFEANSLQHSPPKIGHVTTINMVRISGGETAAGMIRELHAHFDMHIGVLTSLNAVLNELQRWLHMANFGMLNNDRNSVTIDWIRRSPKSQVTDINNIMVAKFLKYLQDREITYALAINPGSSDGRFLREQGLPVVGFTPINMTPPLSHDTNEFVYRKQFLDNISLMARLVQHMATEIKETKL